MLKQLWQGWKRIAHKIGNFQSRVLLTVIYFVLVLPFGLCVRFFSDSLRTKNRATQWLDHPDETQDLAWARKQ